ncbi:MAG TPA: hypothetical protein VKS21_13780 [Spirochaetota bacterium]|nr:hypothetical protein [Spirochaetota bacterium]
MRSNPFSLYKPVLVFGSLVLLLAGDSFDELDQRITSSMNRLEKRYNRAAARIDRRFARILDDEWESVTVKKGAKKYKKPKLDKPPQAEPAKQTPNQALPRAEINSVKKTDSFYQHPRPRQELTNINKYKDVTVKFFSLEFTIPLPAAVTELRLDKISHSSIAAYYRRIAAMEWFYTATNLDLIRSTRITGDWSYMLLLDRLAARLFPDDKTSQLLLQWVLFNKSGYKTRLAYSSDKVYLLFASRNKIYGSSFFTFGKDKYYSLNKKGAVRVNQACYTYPEDYPQADQHLDFHIKRWPVFNYKSRQKTLQFKYKQQLYKIKVSYQPFIPFLLRNHPQSSIDIYAAAPLYNDTAAGLYSALEKHLRGKTEGEAVNLLLAFCQKAFPYKTDAEQFGSEKWMFPEEVLHYRYSDCEDRSVLFAGLVKKLLDLDVVLLQYPGHMATAVAFSRPAGGAALAYKGKQYTVCDPTYINATYGMQMPFLEESSIEVTGF